MFNQLLNVILLHSNPRNYLDLLQSNKLLNGLLSYQEKREYKRQFITFSCKESTYLTSIRLEVIIKHYKTLLNSIIIREFLIEKTSNIYSFSQIYLVYKKRSSIIIKQLTYKLNSIWRMYKYKLPNKQILYNFLYKNNLVSVCNFFDLRMGFNEIYSSENVYQHNTEINFDINLKRQKELNYPILLDLKNKKFFKNKKI